MVRIFAVAVVATFAVACSSGTTGSGGAATETGAEVISRIGESVCMKLQQCFPAAFASAFPGGESSCEDKVEQGLPSSDAMANCQKSTVDACVNAISAMACPANVDSFQTPSACTSGC